MKQKIRERMWKLEEELQFQTQFLSPSRNGESKLAYAELMKARALNLGNLARLEEEESPDKSSKGIMSDPSH